MTRGRPESGMAWGEEREGEMPNNARAAQPARGYIYSPGDFQGMLGLPGDLAEYYGMLDALRDEQTESALLDAEHFWWEILYFTIKHREAEGRLSPATASEMRGYLEGLLHAG